MDSREQARDKDWFVDIRAMSTNPVSTRDTLIDWNIMRGGYDGHEIFES